MHTLVSRLYDILALPTPEDEPVLTVDDDLQIYFTESSQGLEMCCPFMRMPEDFSLLQHCLRLNYAGNVIFATDIDNEALLAVIRLSPESSDDDLLSSMELLINSIRQFKQDVDQEG